MAIIRSFVAVLIAAIGVGTAEADIPKTVASELLPTIPTPRPVTLPPPVPPVPRARAVPTGNPGTWVTSDDYPSVALRMGVSGIVGVRLFIDPKGKVYHCQILSSSAYDLLDNAACEILSARAEFVPGRNGRGKAVADVWTSRFVWRLPSPVPSPVIEGTGVYLLTINQMGSVVDCKLKLKPIEMDEGSGECPEMDSLPRIAGLEMRNYGSDPFVDSELEMSTALTPETRDWMVRDKPDYEVRSLLVFRFEIDPATGKLSQCALERQQGSAALIHDFCTSNARLIFAPGKNALGEIVTGPLWHIERVLLRKLVH